MFKTNNLAIRLGVFIAESQHPSVMCCKAAPIPDFLEWDAGCYAAVGDTSRPPRMRWCFCWWPVQVTLGCCKWWKAQIEGRCKVVRGKNM